MNSQRSHSMLARVADVAVVAVLAGAILTALPSAPSIEGIAWRAEDIGGGGIIDRSRATLTFGADGRISGSASCNQYSGSYALDRGALSFTSALVATHKACAPSLMDQERHFLAILGAARQIELLPTGALLVSTPDGKSLRFFPEQPVKPAVAPPLMQRLEGPDAGIRPARERVLFFFEMDC